MSSNTDHHHHHGEHTPMARNLKPIPGRNVLFSTPTGVAVYGTILDTTAAGFFRIVNTNRTHEGECLDADSSRPVRLYVVDPSDIKKVLG